MSPATSDFRGEYDESLQLPETLTLEQYRRVIFRPDAHFVDGNIIPRQLGDYVHSLIVGAVASTLQKAWEGASICISLRLQTSATRIRVCDLVLLEKEAPREAVPTVAPSLCIEILSPEQAPASEQEALADYLTMGVPNIWLVDPLRRSAYTFDAAGLHETDSTNLKVTGSPIHLDLTEAFAALD